MGFLTFEVILICETVCLSLSYIVLHVLLCCNTFFLILIPFVPIFLQQEHIYENPLELEARRQRLQIQVLPYTKSTER